MSKSVSIVSTVHFPGDIRVFFKEALTLAEAGYRINFIVRGGRVIQTHPNITYHLLEDPRSLGQRIRNLGQAIRLALRLDDDIIHFHDPELLLLGLIMKIFRRKKVIYDIHEIHHDAIRDKPYLPRPLAQLIAGLFWGFERFALLFFDMNILAEAGYQPYYRRYRHIILQNFILEQHIAPGAGSGRDLDREIHLIYLGSITRIRGIFEMIELARLLAAHRKLHFHLIGPFNEAGLEAAVRRTLEAQQLAGMVTLHGPMPLPDALVIERNCDFGLVPHHPTLNNATILPAKLFEYMANGVIPIMNRIPVWEAFNRQHRCGLVIDFFNLAQEREQILAFLENREELARLKAQNIETVRRHYTWEAESEKLLALYAALCGQKLLK